MLLKLEKEDAISTSLIDAVIWSLGQMCFYCVVSVIGLMSSICSML